MATITDPIAARAQATIELLERLQQQFTMIAGRDRRVAAHCYLAERDKINRQAGGAPLLGRLIALNLSTNENIEIDSPESFDASNDQIALLVAVREPFAASQALDQIGDGPLPLVSMLVEALTRNPIEVLRVAALDEPKTNGTRDDLLTVTQVAEMYQSRCGRDLTFEAAKTAVSRAKSLPSIGRGKQKRIRRADALDWVIEKRAAADGRGTSDPTPERW